MSARSCMMSGRLPFGRPCHVGGNSETRLNHTVPLSAVEITRRFVAEIGADFDVMSVTSYLCQLAKRRGTSALAWMIAPSVLSIATVSEPEKFSPAFA